VRQKKGKKGKEEKRKKERKSINGHRYAYALGKRGFGEKMWQHIGQKGPMSYEIFIGLADTYIVLCISMYGTNIHRPS
jgi:hypothetical protein